MLIPVHARVQHHGVASAGALRSRSHATICDGGRSWHDSICRCTSLFNPHCHGVAALAVCALYIEGPCMLCAQIEEDAELRWAYNAEWDDSVSGNKTALTMLHWPRSSEAELVRIASSRVPLPAHARTSNSAHCNLSCHPLMYAPQIDAKKRKTFLKRTHCEGLGSSCSPLQPNSFVMVMARRLQILSPADATTRDKLSENPATRSKLYTGKTTADMLHPLASSSVDTTTVWHSTPCSCNEV